MSMIVVIALIADTCADTGSVVGVSFHGGVVGAVVNCALATRTALDTIVGALLLEALKSANELLPVIRLSPIKLPDKSADISVIPIRLFL